MNKVKKFLYSQKAAPYVFILPFVLTVILFWVFPIANGVLLSFQDVLKDKWVGMNDYKLNQLSAQRVAVSPAGDSEEYFDEEEEEFFS